MPDRGQDSATRAPSQAVVHLKGRPERACQACRANKKRCDGEQAEDRTCSYCFRKGFQCLFGAGASAGPPEKLPRVKALEARIADLTRLMQRLQRSHKMPQSGTQACLTDKEHLCSACTRGALAMQLEPFGVKLAESDPAVLGPSDDDGDGAGGIERRLAQIKRNHAHPRFVGESSDGQLLQVAFDAQRLHVHGPSNSRPVQAQARRAVAPVRPEFWRHSSWDTLVPAHAREASVAERYVFPDADLVPALVALYFAHVNVFWPLLHRPTFEKAVAEGLHLRDLPFATVLILVCAAGAQYADDPRAFMEPGRPESAGWKWFKQVQISKYCLFGVPSLYNIQTYCLSAMFLQHTSMFQGAWTLIGIGVRMAQDVGAHRQAMYGDKPDIYDELWKRTFWVLACYDHILSLSMGRQCAIQEEDLDIDFPIECDDEYWADREPHADPVQPAGKPSLVTSFVYFAKLGLIAASATRNLYSTTKDCNTLFRSINHRTDREMVADLDSALNAWIESLPEHLRWCPEQPSDTFFKQSALLHTFYHGIRIMVHRAFIPVPGHRPFIPLPSFALCTHAASCTSHIIDAQRRRTGAPMWELTKPAFISATILMLGVWGRDRFGSSFDPVRQVEDVHKCLDFLAACESRVYMAGRLADWIRGLVWTCPVQRRTALTDRSGHDAAASRRPREDMVIFNADGLGLILRDSKTIERMPPTQLHRAEPTGSASPDVGTESCAGNVDATSVGRPYLLPEEYTLVADPYTSTAAGLFALPAIHSCVAADPCAVLSTVPSQWGAGLDTWISDLDVISGWKEPRLLDGDTAGQNILP